MSSGASRRSLSRLNHDISEITVERTLKHIAQLHGGEVSVESKSGEGATFKVVF